MSEQTETLWQIGQPGKGSQEFIQVGDWQKEFIYVVGSDQDPINQPQMPSLLVVPGRKTKPRSKGKQLFSTDKLNIQFTLTQNYSVGELTLFYNFFGSEVDTLLVDGEPVTEIVGVGSGKPTKSQIPLPALNAGQHTLSLTTAGGSGNGSHRIDYLKLEAVVATQQPQTPQTSQTPQTPKETQETMVEKKTETTPSEVSSTPEKKKSYVPTSQTGLQDYSYWTAYANKHAKAPDQRRRPFRRGRIWA
ncbi:MAG: cyanobactin biosynthesis PatC/TenC/TruC family protein [Brasilonema angustatum HA4187-MV1]|jgi:cyanobactin cluster PatC/TenC/TruC protein|nr:cyanobactin biosynthesis PatC/TenC/TruC family protein [Brasilonema angustatum HA4187-MV1]